MKAYAYDSEGYFQGEIDCQPSPLEPGIFLIPAGAVAIKPVIPSSIQDAKLVNGSWVLVESRAETARKAAVAKAAQDAIDAQNTAIAEAAKKSKDDAKKSDRDAIKTLAKSDIKTVGDLADALLKLRNVLGLND